MTLTLSFTPGLLSPEAVDGPAASLLNFDLTFSSCSRTGTDDPPLPSSSVTIKL